MATRIVCPHCQSAFNVNDATLGKKVRCKSCEEAFTAREPDDTGVKKKTTASIKADPAGRARSAKTEAGVSTRRKGAPADEDDRPRKRARDDEDDDAPRSKKAKSSREDDDEDDRKDRKSRAKKTPAGGALGLIIGLAAGGVVLLGLGIGGLVWFLNRETTPREPAVALDLNKLPDPGKNLDAAMNNLPQVGQLPVPGNVPDPANIFNNPNTGVTSPAEALLTLKSPNVESKNRATSYLSQTEPSGPEQAEIARLLDQARTIPGVFNADSALIRWATKEQVPALINLIENNKGLADERRKSALRVLGKLQDERGLDIIIENLGAFTYDEAARQALDSFGDQAKPGLIRHAFHKNHDVRRHVQVALQRTNVPTEDLLPLAITAMGSAENDLRYAARDWVAKAPLVVGQQAKVARALDAMLVDPRPVQARRGGQGPADLGGQGLGAGPDRDLEATRLHARRDPPDLHPRQGRARAELLAKELSNFDGGARSQAVNALKQIGREVAGKYVINYVNDRFGGAQAKQLLQEWGTGTGDLFGQTLKDLNDPMKRHGVLDQLTQTPPADAQRAQVLQAVQPLMTDPDRGTSDRASKVFLAWAGKEQIQKLIEMATLEQSQHRHQALDALARFPTDPMALPTIARRLAHFFDRGHARSVLEKIGAPAEPAVLQVLGTAGTDKGLIQECCHVLQKIGTKQSCGTLQQLFIIANAQKDRNLANLAQQTFQLCQTR